MKLYRTKLAISSLSIYRNLLKDPVIKKFIELVNCLCTKMDATDNAAAFLNLFCGWEIFFCHQRDMPQKLLAERGVGEIEHFTPAFLSSLCKCNPSW